MPAWWPKKAGKALNGNGGGVHYQFQQQGTASTAAPQLGFTKSAGVKSDGNKKAWDRSRLKSREKGDTVRSVFEE